MVLLVACGGPSYDTTGSGRDGEDPVAVDPGAPDPGTGPTDPSALSPDAGTGVDDGYADTPAASGELSPEWEERLLARRVDYSEALRVASLRLRGDLPTLVEIRFVAGAPDPRVAYEGLIDRFLDDPRFLFRVRELWRDTMKMGGGTLDTAPLFATQLVVEDRSMTELFTATTGTCPTYDGETGTIVAADCDNGVPAHAGVLTNPAVMRHFFSNLAFRRVRWLQETFACGAFPAEHGEPMDVGGVAPYTAPWPFESIAGERNGGRVDFLDTSSVICANCHATINHLAPLFGRFDEDGAYSMDFAVPLPSDGSPTAMLSDWLPPGENTAWRLGVPAPDLPALGTAMAADPEVARCTVARVWNWALGKGDIVLTLTVVPDVVIDDIVADYISGGHRMKQLVFDVYTSEDFVRF
jgi:hypothetical protein